MDFTSKLKNFLFLFYFLVVFSTAGFGQTNNSTAQDLIDKAKRLQLQLGLSDVQTNRLTVIFNQASAKFAQIESTSHGDISELIIKMEPLRKETINKIKILLTPAQVVKFDKLVEKLNNSTNDRIRYDRP